MSRLKDLQDSTSEIQVRAVEKPVSQRTRTGPVHTFEVTGRMHAAEEKVELLEKEREENIKRVGELRMLPIDELHEVSGRRRKLTPQEYSDLRDNMKETGKALEPVTVRPRPQGGYEVISGNNRTAIGRELKWPEIMCRVEVTDDVTADRDGFYTNLFQTTLTPHEKYIGFKRLLDSGEAVTQADLVRLTGRNKDEVSNVMKFESLPDEVHELLKEQPSILGLQAAVELARLALEGHGEKVTEAVRKIAFEKLPQGQAAPSVIEAIALEKKSNRPARKPPAKNAPIPIKAGRDAYCTFVCASKFVRIEFESKEFAEAVKDEIAALLQKHADALKKKE